MGIVEPSVQHHRSMTGHADLLACPRTSLYAQTRRKLPRKLVCVASAKILPEKSSLVVVGSVNADMVLQIDRLPREGETLAAKSLQTFPGGKGANQAAAAGKLGQHTLFLGQACIRIYSLPDATLILEVLDPTLQVGKDSNADFLQSSLTAAGVDLTHLTSVDGPSGTAVILLQPSGENSIIIVGGANTSDWKIEEKAKTALRSAGALLLQREIPEEINTAVAEVASEAGVRVIMDCGGIEAPISDKLLCSVSILSPNETELARLTDLPTGSKEETEAAAKTLLERGVKEAVLVKRGGQGSLLVTRNASLEQGIFKAEKIVDTTGAGDCYTGAFAVALLEGLENKQAMQFAAAAASLCVQREGAMTSLPKRNEVEHLLQN